MTTSIISVTGTLVVDLTDLHWRSDDVWAEIGRRFGYIADAPNGAPVVIRLNPDKAAPRNTFWQAFAEFTHSPARLAFTIEGGDSGALRRACADLRLAIAEWTPQEGAGLSPGFA